MPDAPRNEALEQLVREQFGDPHVMRVYRDWLLEHSDPLGELMALAPEAGESQASAAMNEERARQAWNLMAREWPHWFGGALPFGKKNVQWSHGLPVSLALPVVPSWSHLVGLLQRRICRFVSWLSCGCDAPVSDSDALDLRAFIKQLQWLAIAPGTAENTRVLLNGSPFDATRGVGLHVILPEPEMASARAEFRARWPEARLEPRPTRSSQLYRFDGCHERPARAPADYAARPFRRVERGSVSMIGETVSTGAPTDWSQTEYHSWFRRCLQCASDETLLIYARCTVIHRMMSDEPVWVFEYQCKECHWFSSYAFADDWD